MEVGAVEECLDDSILNILSQVQIYGLLGPVQQGSFCDRFHVFMSCEG